MSRTESRTIDGLEVRSTKLPVMRRGPLALRLLQTIGPVIVPVAMASKAADQVDASVLSGAFAQVPADVDVNAIVREILAGTDVVADGKVVSLTSDAMINGVIDSFATLMRVCKFSLEVNYGDFFAELPAMAGGVTG